MRPGYFFPFVLACCFIFTQIIAPSASLAQEAWSVLPSARVTPSFAPVLIKGITVHPEDPFRFDFIVSPGDTGSQGDALKAESRKLIQYFLAALTIPENEMWVNLSPYEKDRIVPEFFGQTLMGEDLLSLDQALKQIASSLTDPAQAFGKEFWDRVYARAQAEFGTLDVPLEMFNKIWIVPQDVLIFERGNSAFVVRRHMKVMLESDYLAMKHNGVVPELSGVDVMTREVMRQIVLPAIEHEVNEGPLFANLRQIYHSMILASWYKKNLAGTLLSRAYVDRHKISGVRSTDKNAVRKIYAGYLSEFNKGSYNYIKEDIDPVNGQAMPRKYFSGGIPGILAQDIAETSDLAALSPSDQRELDETGVVTIEVAVLPAADAEPAFDAAMVDREAVQRRIAEIDDLSSRIGQERRQKGSGHLPRLLVMSDLHGEIKGLLMYVADALSREFKRPFYLDDTIFPSQSITEQMEAQGVSRENLKALRTKFMFLGDLLDRGHSGVKVFRACQELIDLGVAEYVTGNHDLWAFLNTMGFHLPIYKGYKFYGDPEVVRELKWLVESHWNDPDIARDRFAWWTAKLAEYNARQKSLQGLLFNRMAKERRQKMLDIYQKNKDAFTREERLLVEDIVGVFNNVNVYTGLNAVGMMSLQWWGSRLAQLRAIVEKARGTESPLTISVWEDFEENTLVAALIVEERYHEALERGEWWWQVFNAINDQNYASVEWWGKDWSSHEGWGTAVIKELNRIDGSDRWNQSNYIANPHLIELAGFYRKHFTLFLKDAYGNYYTHGWLPVDEATGEVSFTYKGVIYKGEGVWAGLEIIQNEVRDLNTPLYALHEALTLVNSLYADRTTKIKPADIQRYVHQVGLEKIFTGLGVRTWFMGHNPLNKLMDRGIDFMIRQTGKNGGDFVAVNTDKGIHTAKYFDGGGYSLVDEKGIRLVGFSGPDLKKIIDNPDTFLFRMAEDKSYVVVKSSLNLPLERDAFLDLMALQLKEEKQRLEASVNDFSQAWTRGGIDLDPAMMTIEVTKDAKGGGLPPNDQPVSNINISGLVPVILNITGAR